MEHTWIELIAIMLGPGGAVYIGLKGAINGLNRAIRETNRMTVANGKKLHAIHDDVKEIKIRQEIQ